MLVPGLLGSRDEYGQRYCGGKQVFIARGMYDWRNSSNLAELNAVLQKHVLIRRLKKNVLQDLPAKLRQRIPIEVDPDCVKVHCWSYLELVKFGLSLSGLLPACQGALLGLLCACQACLEFIRLASCLPRCIVGLALYLTDFL